MSDSGCRTNTVRRLFKDLKNINSMPKNKYYECEYKLSDCQYLYSIEFISHYLSPIININRCCGIQRRGSIQPNSSCCLSSCSSNWSRCCWHISAFKIKRQCNIKRTRTAALTFVLINKVQNGFPKTNDFLITRIYESYII